VYTQAVTSNKRIAQSKVVRMMISNVGTVLSDVGTTDFEKVSVNAGSGFLAPIARPDIAVTLLAKNSQVNLECVAKTKGLEPATSAVTVSKKRVTN
jgi:hypothetical protein